jgi:arylsulfatase
MSRWYVFIAGLVLSLSVGIVRAADQPNIVFVLTDNLGYGELGVYGGGALRGAPTPHIDALAGEGLRLTNFNVEAQCTPSRSAIMTGRYAVRSGTHSVPLSGGLDGLTQWEVTIAELLSQAGYATGHFGKWHLGSSEGRFPTDQGFDEWYGISKTTDEAYWPDSAGFQQSGMEPTHVMEGLRGQKSRNLAVYDLEQRRLIDREAVDRTADFMRRQVKAGKPFYAYVPLTQVHFPTLPHPDFAGVTGNGDFADSMVQTDHYVGELLDLVDKLGIRDNTIFVFTSDNGPDPNWPYQGSAGPWTGYYFTHQEGSLRAPFIIRWPGKISSGRVSNEIVHEMDTFVTFARIAGVQVPGDRAIDGVDQLDFFLGEQQKSNRDNVLAFVADRLEAIKWNDWKVELYEQQRDWWTPPAKFGTPKLYNLLADPREEYPETSIRNSWVAHPALERAAKFRHSLVKHPPIPTGTPDPYTP